MEESKRQKQIANLIQQEMSDIFQREGLNVIHNGMVSISKVKVTPDLLEARIYLSFFQIEDDAALLKQIKERDWELRKHLAARIKNQVRRIPVLNYFKDDTTLDALFKKIHLQEWNQTRAVLPHFNLTKHWLQIEKFKIPIKADVIYFDAFSPREQPELWTEDIFLNMYSMLKWPGKLVTYCAQGQMKRNLKSAGFIVKALPGFANKREMTIGLKV